MNDDKEHAAIERLRARGATIKQRKDGTAGAISRPPGGATITDSEIDDIAACRRLRRLDLSHSGITDEQLVRLLALTELTELQLTSTQVTADGLERLAGQPKLKLLVITGCKIDTPRLRELRKRMIHTRIVHG